MKILIADSHPSITEELTQALTELLPQAMITAANDANEIQQICKEKHFDIIFIEIEMQHINGIGLAKRILSWYPRTNIIYITEHEEYALESYETNASGFLLKPVTDEKLRFTLDHLRFPVSNITEEMLNSLNAGGKQIGLCIRKCREERGLTRDEFAELMYVSLVTVFRWESGTRVPEVVMIMQIAKVLGVEPNDLLGTY